MKNKRLGYAVLICVMVLVCLFGYIATSLAIGADIGHTCNHEECLTCIGMALGQQIGTWQIAAAALIWLFVSILVPKFTPLPDDHRSLFLSTPVCRKVKLLN